MISAAPRELSSDQSPGVGTNGVTRVISTPTLPHTHCQDRHLPHTQPTPAQQNIVQEEKLKTSLAYKYCRKPTPNPVIAI